MEKEENSRIITDQNDDDSLFSMNDEFITAILLKIKEAFKNEIHPERIFQGSSGSYFIKDVNQECFGIFKPKDEEPYGPMNPKWGKYLQKLCSPCCFGRGCLLLNQGYLSEVGASLVDTLLNLNIVPKTVLIKLSSQAFNYSTIDRAKTITKKNIVDKFPRMAFKRVGLPKKRGSFQLFVKGYKDANYWLEKFEHEPLSPKLQSQFQLQFERLVILDYIIRNTDRGSDNWLINYEKADIQNNHEEIDDWNLVEDGNISIAAIDNGLAFPFKHPDEWRTYPYNWASLKYAHIPFSEETRDEFIDMLANDTFIQSLWNNLYKLFKTDKSFEFEEFYGQMSVLRGQIFNLHEALRDRISPYELVQKPTFIIENSMHMYGSINRSPSHKLNKQEAFFTCC